MNFEEFLKTQGDTLLSEDAIARLAWNAALDEAAKLMESGQFCRLVEHMQNICDCEEMGAAIREGKAK